MLVEETTGDISPSTVPTSEVVESSSGSDPVQRERRASCHRCGNIRKNMRLCDACPHVFCNRCVEKMVDEYSDSCFENGCPVCKGMCCCSEKTLQCTRKIHCYKKCPTTRCTSFGRTARTKSAGSTPKKSADSDEDDSNFAFKRGELETVNVLSVEKRSTKKPTTYFGYSRNSMDNTIEEEFTRGILLGKLLCQGPRLSPVESNGPFFFQPSFADECRAPPLCHLTERLQMTKGESGKKAKRSHFSPGSRRKSPKYRRNKKLAYENDTKNNTFRHPEYYGSTNSASYQPIDGNHMEIYNWDDRLSANSHHDHDKQHVSHGEEFISSPICDDLLAWFDERQEHQADTSTCVFPETSMVVNKSQNEMEDMKPSECAIVMEPTPQPSISQSSNLAPIIPSQKLNQSWEHPWDELAI